MATAATTTPESLVAEKSYPLRVALLSVLIGIVISTFWSAAFVDTTIGGTVADTLWGPQAREATISGAVAGALYALVTGLAGTFTACNICAFSAIAPLAADKRSAGQTLKPLLYLSAGMIVVAGLYGAIGALVGPSLPQLSETRLGDPENGIRLRSLQSMVVFVSIGVIYILWGLMTLGVMPNPFAGVGARYPWARSVFMGATIGAFLIGRPYGLFRHMFEYAASTQNPFFGALAFILQSLGNIVLMVALFLLLIYGTGGRFERWLHAKPGRVAIVTAAALIVAGTFFATYWGPRLLARNGLFFWPYWDWETYTLLFRAR
ncbi:MAG TPA: hypothetical protein VFZ66_08080 [Herpetosiphonaceae bacterium]